MQYDINLLLIEEMYVNASNIEVEIVIEDDILIYVDVERATIVEKVRMHRDKTIYLKCSNVKLKT